MSVTLAPDTNREQWLAARRKGIGASEIAAVLGISPWESPFSLYWRKVNGWDYEPSAEMEWGNRLEDAIADKYADAHNVLLESPGLVVHPLRPWHIATPDRTVRPYCDCPDEVCVPTDKLGMLRCTVCDGWGYGPVDRLLELKTAHNADGWGEPGTAAIPVHYRAQAQWQMAVCDIERVDFAVLIGGSDYREYTVAWDQRDIDTSFEHARRFMARMEAGDPPPLDDHHATLATVKRLHPDLDDEAVEVEHSIAAGYRRACAMERKAKAVKARYEIQLRAQMGRARKATSDGQFVASRSVYEVAEHAVKAHTVDRLNPPRGKS